MSLLWHSASSEINTSFIFCPLYNTSAALIVLLWVCWTQQYYATEVYFHLPENTPFSKQFSKSFYLFYEPLNIPQVSSRKQVGPIKGSRGLRPEHALFPGWHISISTECLISNSCWSIPVSYPLSPFLQETSNAVTYLCHLFSTNQKEDKDRIQTATK